MKIIAFSLWGDIPMYTIGAIRNAEIAKQIFPDWICRYYVANTVPLDIVERIESMDNTEVIMKDEPGTPHSMFWRFEPAWDSSVDYMIVRDTDSRLGVREKAAVDEWIGSGKKLHIMRDHPYHGTVILGGMWGCRPVLLPEMKTMTNEWLQNKEDKKGSDQHFLQTLYPLVSSDSCVHDEFFEKLPFPMKREDDPVVKFIGQVFDENDNYGGDWKGDLKVLGIEP